MADTGFKALATAGVRLAHQQGVGDANNKDSKRKRLQNDATEGTGSDDDENDPYSNSRPKGSNPTEAEMDNTSLGQASRGAFKPLPLSQPGRPPRKELFEDSLECRWPFCGRHFPSADEAREHEQTHGEDAKESCIGPDQFMCRIPGCQKKFNEFGKFRKHLQCHLPPRYGCNVCGKKFHEFAKMRRHESIHIGTDRYVCSFEGCGRVFNFKANMKTHERVHTGERPFMCTHPGCGRRFAQASNRNAHSKTHTSGRDSSSSTSPTAWSTTITPTPAVIGSSAVSPVPVELNALSPNPGGNGVEVPKARIIASSTKKVPKAPSNAVRSDAGEGVKIANDISGSSPAVKDGKSRSLEMTTTPKSQEHMGAPSNQDAARSGSSMTALSQVAAAAVAMTVGGPTNINGGEKSSRFMPPFPNLSSEPPAENGLYGRLSKHSSNGPLASSSQTPAPTRTQSAGSGSDTARLYSNFGMMQPSMVAPSISGYRSASPYMLNGHLTFNQTSGQYGTITSPRAMNMTPLPFQPLSVVNNGVSTTNSAFKPQSSSQQSVEREKPAYFWSTVSTEDLRQQAPSPVTLGGLTPSSLASLSLLQSGTPMCMVPSANKSSASSSSGTFSDNSLLFSSLNNSLASHQSSVSQLWMHQPMDPERPGSLTPQFSNMIFSPDNAK